MTPGGSSICINESGWELPAGSTFDRSVTALLAQRAGALSFSDLPDDVRTIAKHCLLDWFGVALAGRHEPLVEILCQVALEEGGREECTLIGRRQRTSLLQAALVNGAMGHALDYDDVIVMMGHPSVPVIPAILALAQRYSCTGADLLTALVAGVETEVGVALYMGSSHYSRGFHGTATYGAFGAAAAAGNLLRLNSSQMTTAFGIAGVQAAGLKAAFGSMTKPFQAGKASANGLMAALLAMRGYTSNSGILEAKQGFGATQSDSPSAQAVLVRPPSDFAICDTLFKYHAACYLTHSAINAALEIRQNPDFQLSNVERVEVGIDPGHLSVCAIEKPRTGLECKFSIAMVVAMALCGENTADPALFQDSLAARPDLVVLRDKITLVPRVRESATCSDVALHLVSGEILAAVHDVGVPATDLNLQGQDLRRKFRTIAESALPGRTELCADLVWRLDELEDLSPLFAFLG